MPFYFFQWTDEIIEHLAENGVLPDEFEAVVCNTICEQFRRGETPEQPSPRGGERAARNERVRGCTENFAIQPLTPAPLPAAGRGEKDAAEPPTKWRNKP